MRVNVLLFGPQAALAEKGEAPLELPDGATAEDALAALGDSEPALRDSLATSRLAINHEFALPSQSICESDELALIGMVSGG